MHVLRRLARADDCRFEIHLLTKTETYFAFLLPFLLTISINWHDDDDDDDDDALTCSVLCCNIAVFCNGYFMEIRAWLFWLSKRCSN